MIPFNWHPKTSTSSSSPISTPRIPVSPQPKAAATTWNLQLLEILAVEIKVPGGVSAGRSLGIIPCSARSRPLHRMVSNYNLSLNRMMRALIPWIRVSQAVSMINRGNWRILTWFCWILGWIRRRPVWSLPSRGVMRARRLKKVSEMQVLLYSS